MRLPLVGLLLLVLAGCAHSATRMNRNVIGGHPVGGDLALNVEKSAQGDSARYELFVHWTSNFRLDIRAGQSLTIMADREQLNFTATKNDIRQDSNCESGPCTYDERVYYPVNAGELHRIADAQNVTVEVTGHKRSITRNFDYINFDNFRDFITRNVPATSATRQ